MREQVLNLPLLVFFPCFCYLCNWVEFFFLLVCLCIVLFVQLCVCVCVCVLLSLR
jgi:hypothetical protein